MVLVHLATGFEEIEAITVVDILRRAGIDVKTVSMTGERSVTGTHGITVGADLMFDEADYDACEMIVLPGGMPGTTNLGAHEGLCDKILDFVATEKYICAICAAPMILGKLGVLKDRYATIYPGMESELLGAFNPDECVVEYEYEGAGDADSTGDNEYSSLGDLDCTVCIDGKIITSKAPGTAMDFALAIVSVLKGDDVAGALGEDLVLKVGSEYDEF